jgi:hypothetical protein
MKIWGGKGGSCRWLGGTQAPSEHDRVDHEGPSLLQGPRGLVQGRPRGHDVIHEQKSLPLDPSSIFFRDLEGSVHVLQSFRDRFHPLFRGPSRSLEPSIFERAAENG